MTSMVTGSEIPGKVPAVLQNSGAILPAEQKVVATDTITSADEQESCCFWSFLSSFFCCICNFFNWLCSSKAKEPKEKQPEAEATPVEAVETARPLIVKKAPTDPRIQAFVARYYFDYYTDPDSISEPIDSDKFLKDFLALPKEAIQKGQVAVWNAHFEELKKKVRENAPDPEVRKAINAYIKANPFDSALMECLRSL